MSVKNRLLPLVMTSIDSANFTGSYQVINTNGLAHPAIILDLVNNSSVGVTVSFDGVNDAYFIPTLKDRQFNFQSNKGFPNYVGALAQGTKVYVKASAGTGLVYLSGWYQPQGS